MRAHAISILNIIPEMVTQPFSPPIHPQDYNPGVPSVEYPPSQTSTRKRKRDYDDLPARNEYDQLYHNNKRTHIDIRPLTPTSPPSYLPSVQNLSPSRQESQYIYGPTKQDISYYPPPDNLTPPSDVQLIPSQNLFLRNLHLKSRIYIQKQRQTEDKDEDMDGIWEEEEEIVAERYAAMNKLLGSRKMQW
jgi:hypothetical protein